MQVVVIAVAPHNYSISLLLNVIITNKTNKGDSRYLARLACKVNYLAMICCNTS